MAMDFFEHQDIARRKTGRLVILFLLAVVAIIAVIYLVAAALFLGVDEQTVQADRSLDLWDPGLFFLVAVVTLAVISLGSLYKTIELSAGGEKIALMLGGRLLHPNTQDLDERRVLNVVEEMSLASGVPVPPVYVLDRERGINAFAAGFEPGDAVIGVTRGTIELLNRDELQGVIAHEFSHILNGDMRLNIRLIGILHGILILAILGYILMRFGPLSGGSSSRRREGGGAAAAILLLGLTVYLVGYIGVFFGKLIKSAVSRQREFLADAAAVQFTRNPQGIAGALKKIGGWSPSSRIEDSHAEEASHMFFGDAFAGSLFNLFSTHPPLAERIRRVDPTFDGQFPQIDSRADAPVAAMAGFAGGAAPAAETQASAGLADRSRAELAALRARSGRTALNPEQALARVGTADAEAIHYAHNLVTALPAELDQAAHEPYGARAVVYALLLDKDLGIRRRQLEGLQTQAEPQSFKETLRLSEIVDSLGDEYRLPVADLTLSALKSLSPGQYSTFRKNVETLVKADNQIALSEYVLWSVLVRHLDEFFGHRKPPKVRYRALAPLIEPAAQVVAVLAHAGNPAATDAQRAYEAGMQKLGRGDAMPPRDQCTLGALDGALKQLAEGSPQVKKRVLDACATCVAANGKTTVEEAELLRAVAESLGCPMPPILPPGSD